MTASAKPGLVLLQREMDHQRDDAIATLAAVRPLARDIAASIRATGRLVLYGMGGSHNVNRSAEVVYRSLGIDARSVVASEALLASLPAGPRTALLVSQSGGSGEIIDLIGRPAGEEKRFGMTLDAESPLAQRLPSLVAAGGPEVAYAATRSTLLTVTLHAALLEALGLPSDAVVAEIGKPNPTLPEGLAATIARSDITVYVAQHALQGIAEGGELATMELARRPAIALEGGQFRHGPMEFLRPGVAVVAMRSTGPDKDRIPPLVRAAVEAGASTIVFDVSGERPLPGTTTLALGKAEGLAACVAALYALQSMVVATALLTVDNIGVPLRSAKVTA
jgi:fructoselysine-6-P-deglycase FrlB-like protein